MSRRVSSPSAAKSGAAPRRSSRRVRRALGDMALDRLHLLGPAALVHAIGERAARERDAVEPGLDDRQPRAAGDRLELESDQGALLAGVVDAALDRVGMPAPRDVA